MTNDNNTDPPQNGPRRVCGGVVAGNVVPLRDGFLPVEAIAPVVTETVTLLEEYLARAKKGEVIGVAVVAFLRDQTVVQNYGGLWRRAMLIFGCDWLMHIVRQHIDEEDELPPRSTA